VTESKNKSVVFAEGRSSIGTNQVDPTTRCLVLRPDREIEMRSLYARERTTRRCGSPLESGEMYTRDKSRERCTPGRRPYARGADEEEGYTPTPMISMHQEKCNF